MPRDIRRKYSWLYIMAGKWVKLQKLWLRNHPANQQKVVQEQLLQSTKPNSTVNKMGEALYSGGSQKRKIRFLFVTNLMVRANRE